MSTWSTSSTYNFDNGQGAFVNGHLYVANYVTGQVTQTDLDGTNVVVWFSGLTHAQGCATDGVYLYVSYGTSVAKILLSNPSDPLTNTTWAGGFSGAANDLVIIGDGYLYVANGDGISKVYLANPLNPLTNMTWATGVVSNAFGLAIDSTDVYVTRVNSDVYTVPLATGGVLTSWYSGLANAIGLAIYGANLYVSSVTGGNITQITLATKSPTNFVSSGLGGVHALMVYDAHVYASYAGNTIGKFSISDLTWSTGYSFNLGGSVVANGHLYVGDSGTNTVVKTNLDGTINNASWATGLDTPSFCAVSGDYLYVSNRGNGNISKISLLDASVTLNWVTLQAQVLGLAVSGDYLYAVNYSSGNISKILLTDGSFTLDWGQVATSNPHGLAVSGDYLYVANYFSSYISKISLLDATVTLDWATGLTNPIGLAVYGENLYVGNYGSDTVTQMSFLNPANQTQLASGMSSPAGMTAYDAKLYVSYASSTIATWTLDALPVPPPPLVCFKEGSKILTDKGYVVIEDLRKGDLVKTVKHGFKPIDMIGKRDIVHPALEERIKDQLYKCSQSEYPELFEPLVITGCHAILVDEFVSPEQREKTSEVLGRIFVTDKKYRLPACVDNRTTVYEIKGECTIYHLALENEEYFANYGIYANGLLVETCSKRYLKELSNMELIE